MRDTPSALKRVITSTNIHTPTYPQTNTTEDNPARYGITVWVIATACNHLLPLQQHVSNNGIMAQGKQQLVSGLA